MEHIKNNCEETGIRVTRESNSKKKINNIQKEDFKSQKRKNIKDPQKTTL